MTIKDKPSERDVVSEALSDEHYDRAMLHVVKRMVQEHVVSVQVFANAVKSIRWEQKSATFYMEVIRLAFELEAGLLARELSEKGHERFPDDEELAKAVRIFAPPNVIRSDAKAIPSLDDTIQWFRDHKGEYQGQWVAVRAGELVGVHPTHQGLIESIGDDVFDPSTVVTKVN